MRHNHAEEVNYANDARVRATNYRWWEKIDDKEMTAIVDLDGEICEVPITFEVCPLCSGRGTHVSPSIDCNGLTAEDFNEDPDFLRDYLEGHYNQMCNLCNGRRVVPVCQDEKVRKYLEELEQDKAEMHAAYMAEMRMGA